MIVVDRSRAANFFAHFSNGGGCTDLDSFMDDVAMWLGGKSAGQYLGYSRDWVEIRAHPWQEEHVPDRIRYKLMRNTRDRKYFRPDLDWFLVDR